MAVSGFYGGLLLLLYALIQFYLSAVIPPFKESLFIGTATFCGYYYQKSICRSVHYPDLLKLKSISWLVFITLATVCLVLYSGFNDYAQVLLFAVFILGVSYHNHSKIFFLRNIPLIKNICIAACWIVILFFVFQTNEHFDLKKALYAADLFLIILAQSIYFDLHDKEEDLNYGHNTWSNSHSLAEVDYTIMCLIIVSCFISSISSFFGFISMYSLFSQILFFIGYYLLIRKKNMNWIVISDMVLLVKVLLYLW